MTLENIIKSLKNTLDSLKTHLTNAEKKLSEITKADLQELNKLTNDVKSGPRIQAKRNKLKVLYDARKKEINKFEEAKKNINVLLGNAENKVKSALDALELAVENDPSSVEKRINDILDNINSIFVNSQYVISRYRSGKYVLQQKDSEGNVIIKDEHIYYDASGKNIIRDRIAENSKSIDEARQNLDINDKSSTVNLLKHHALGTYKSKTALDKERREARFNSISNFINQSPIPDTLPIDIAGQMITYSHGSQKSIDSGGNPAPLSQDIERFTGLPTSQITKISAQKLSEHYKQKTTSSLADVKPKIEDTPSSPSLADVKPKIEDTPSSPANIISDIPLAVNTSPIGNEGGGKKKKISIGSKKPKKNNVGGLQSPIQDIKPEVGLGGGSASPGEVSDEMLKVIEQAVFNGASRAFAQFSNGPSAAQPEFGDTTIDKIGETVFKAMQKALDYYSASPAFRMVLVGIDPSVLDQLKNSLSGLPGSGTGDMDKLAEELRKSRESNENLAKMQEARRKKIEAERKKKAKEAEKEKKRIADPNSPESIAKKKKEAEAAERAQKKKDKEDPNSLENIAKAEEKKRKAEEKKAKEDKAKLKAEIEADPFRKRLKSIYKEGQQELTFLYAKFDSYAGWVPGFNNAILKARKSALETLREGYEAFDKKYAESGSAFEGMWASLKAMYSVSPFTVIVAGLTTIGILLGKTIFNAAQKVNTQIKEIAAELGTSNRQSYEMFKNAMNAQTQFENLHASLRDVMDAQKGILGDSGILLRTNDKALSAIADNAKNIGLSVESAGAFYDNLRMKGAGDIEANNLMAASLELADKQGFSPQSIVDDIAQNAEFASKYFSNINKDSKSAHRNLIETNLQVKKLGLNFQKAAKMTQHLLSFEQSITAEVEASIALGTHVDIGKARELLLQDDIAGAMTQMMNAIPGGYEGFQNMDFAERQVTANAIGLEVSELERSLYLREKIKLSNSEDLELAMKHDDYLKKIAGTNDEIYRTELSKIQAAERYNTSIEKLSVSFRYALAPILEAVVPVVDLLANAINKLGDYVKRYLGYITGANENAEKSGGGIKTPDMYQMGLGSVMALVMGGKVLQMLKGPVGKKIGEVVGKARGGFDTLTGTLGTKTNPMYVISLGSGGVVGSGLLGNLTDVINTESTGKKKGRLTKKGLPDRRFKENKIPSSSTTKPGMLKGLANNFKNIKFGSILKNTIKTGGVASAIFGVLDYVNRKQAGQSTAQAASGSIAGVLGGLGGAALGTAIGTALFPGVGTIIGAGIGLLSSMIGGYLGYKTATSISDSAFSPSSFTGSYGNYAGMGLNTAGGIVANNKPIIPSKPIDTAMVDYTPTTFSGLGSNFSSSTQGAGVLKNSTRSVIQNRTSKNSVSQAYLSQVANYEKSMNNEKLVKEQEETNKLLKEFLLKQMQPNVAYFTPNSVKPLLNHMRTKNTQ